LTNYINVIYINTVSWFIVWLAMGGGLCTPGSIRAAKAAPLRMQQGGFWADCSCCPRLTSDLSFLFIPNPDEGLNFLLFPCLLVRLPALLSLKKEDVMKKSGLFIFLVLWLSCPLLAQEKTYDPIFDDPVFMDPGFDLGQVASRSLNYQRYGTIDCGSEAEGYWEPEQRSIIAGGRDTRDRIRR
jgi:hypothetical protein